MAKSALDDPHTNKLNNAQIVLTSLAAGAIAGALAKTTIAPLDRTKINFQIGHKPYSTRKALRFLLETFKKEGFFALWRGNSATMARIVPHAAIQFTAHEQWKRVLKVDQSGKTPAKLFLAGSLAGVTSQSLTYPLDLARARMAVTRKHEYATLRQVFVKIYYTEGLMTFYKGYFPTMAGVVIYAGVSFFTYDTLKRLFRERVDNRHHLPPVASLAFGAVAGLLGQSSSYPLDIVRRRMQTDSSGKYPNIMQTLVHVYRVDGVFNGFYKGITMSWIKGGVAVGISFSANDYIRDYLRVYLNIHTKAKLQNEGIRKGFYKGLSMNWIKGPIAVGISYATYDNVKEFLRNILVKYRNKLLYIE